MIDKYIRDVPDFPKPGIVFKDITPLLASPEGLKEAIDGLQAAVDPSTYDVICGIESRGFIFGTALALAALATDALTRPPSPLLPSRPPRR